MLWGPPHPKTHNIPLGSSLLLYLSPLWGMGFFVSCNICMSSLIAVDTECHCLKANAKTRIRFTEVPQKYCGNLIQSLESLCNECVVQSSHSITLLSATTHHKSEDASCHPIMFFTARGNDQKPPLEFVMRTDQERSRSYIQQPLLQFPEDPRKCMLQSTTEKRAKRFL